MILTGAGDRAFCVGGDVKQRNETGTYGPTSNGLFEGDYLHKLMRDIPKPTIAAVNGPAIAGGTGFALLCDFTLAVPEAKFGYTEVRIGFVPGIVSTFLLRQVGEKVARDLLLTGRIFDAQEALRLGLINEIVSAD